MNNIRAEFAAIHNKFITTIVTSSAAKEGNIAYETLCRIMYIKPKIRIKDAFFRFKTIVPYKSKYSNYLPITTTTSPFNVISGILAEISSIVPVVISSNALLISRAMHIFLSGSAIAAISFISFSIL